MEKEIETKEVEEVVAPEAEENKEEETEKVEETPVEEVEPISYSSKYLEEIEEARAAFLKIYRTQNVIKWIVSAICLGLVVFGCIIVPNLIGGMNGTIAMVAILVGSLAATIVYSVFSRKSIQKKMHAYFDFYYDKVNHFVFEDKAITKIEAQVPGKIQPEAFNDNLLYKDVVDVGSRGLTEIEYNKIPIAVVDAAAQVRVEKRIAPVFVGKYLYAAASYAYDEPLYIYFKGDKRALPPTNIDNVKDVLDDKKMIIRTENKDWKKVINSDVKKILQSIEMNKELVDLSVSLQKGRVFVCMGYDDPLMVLPLQNQFNPKPTEIFKKDVYKVLALIEEFNK